jgi:hypothetical protein
MRHKNIAGQNLTEVALCVIIIGTAIVTMQIYIQRSLQARYKSGADFALGMLQNEAEAQGKTLLALMINTTGHQYDPYYATDKFTDGQQSDNTKGYPDRSINQTSIRHGWKRTGMVENAD